MTKQRLRIIIGSMLVICLLVGCKMKKEYPMSDPTYMRILYQVELDENADADHYETAVTVRSSDVWAHGYLGGYYAEQSGSNEWQFDENKLYELMSGIVFTGEESNGTLNDYILYYIYPCDMNDMLFYHCCDSKETVLTFTWHYDKRGYRIIDQFDTSLVMDRYIAHWQKISDEYGIIPPLKECVTVFEGELPKYEDDQADLDLAVVKARYPDVVPYGIDNTPAK